MKQGHRTNRTVSPRYDITTIWAPPPFYFRCSGWTERLNLSTHLNQSLNPNPNQNQNQNPNLTPNPDLTPNPNLTQLVSKVKVKKISERQLHNCVEFSLRYLF